MIVFLKNSSNAEQKTTLLREACRVGLVEYCVYRNRAMSNPEMLRREVEQSRQEVVRLQRDRAAKLRQKADAEKRANNAAQAALKSSSASTLQSKLREADRYENESARLGGQLADIDKRIVTASTRLADKESRLAKAQAMATKQQATSWQQSFQGQQRAMAATNQSLSTMHERLRRLEELPQVIQVLFLAANPIDQDQLRLDEEVRAITDTIRKAKHRDAVALHSRWAVRPADVLQAINELSPTIIHFSGHGGDLAEIVLQGEGGVSKPVSVAALVSMIASSSSSAQLVVFNTCSSEALAVAMVEKVDYAVGMRGPISDESARLFAAQFYSGIGFGMSIQKAFDQAVALMMAEGQQDFDVPMLLAKQSMDAANTRLVQSDHLMPRSDSSPSASIEAYRAYLKAVDRLMHGCDLYRGVSESVEEAAEPQLGDLPVDLLGLAKWHTEQTQVISGRFHDLDDAFRGLTHAEREPIRLARLRAIHQQLREASAFLVSAEHEELRSSVTDCQARIAQARIELEKLFAEVMSTR